MTERAILSIALGDIAEGEHVGLLLDAEVACLKVRLAAEGQLMPILVRRNGNRAAQPWALVAGRHRVHAARAIGWTAIDAIQVADAHHQPPELRAMQVTENLDRRVLRPIERAIFIQARWDAAYDGVADRPAIIRTISADLPSRTKMERAKAEADQLTAESCGCSLATVRRHRRIYDCIVVDLNDLFAALNAHPAGESLIAVTRIAKLHLVEHRRAAVEKLLAEQDAPAEPDDAGTKETPDEKWLRRANAGFSRVTLGGQRDCIAHFIAARTPTVQVLAAKAVIDRANRPDRRADCEEIAKHALAALTPGERAKLLYSIEGSSR